MTDPQRQSTGAPAAPPVPPMPDIPPVPSAPSVGAESSSESQSAPSQAREPQTVEEYLANFPPVVYVPTTDETDTSHRRVVLHSMQDGRVALFAYSAPDRLRTYYLPDAPWVLLDVTQLQRVHDESPYELLFLDKDPGLRDEES